MARSDSLPPHVDPSLRTFNDVLLGTGGLGYTICYILMTRESIRDRTYAMPLFSLAMNFAWEMVFAMFVAVEVREQAIFTIWMLIDLGLIYALVKHGANEWKHAPAVGRHIGKIFTVMLAWWCVALYAVSIWWLDPTVPVNPKFGKAYNGSKGIDSDELGYWTALVAQIVLSVMSLAQIVVRGNSGGSSYAIWTTRFVGSLSGLNLNYGYCWWVWPEAHGYVANPIAVVMMVTWVLADLAYLFALYAVKQTEVVLPSGRKMKAGLTFWVSSHQLRCFWNTNMASSDDDELKLAMALSMQQSSPETPKFKVANVAIDLTSDTEDEGDDEDMRRAIALSLQEATVLSDSEAPLKSPLRRFSASSNPVQGKEAAQPSAGPVSTRASDGSSSLFGLDRKSMEQERLVRLGKRKRDSLPERPSKQVATMPTTTSIQPPSVKSFSFQNGTVQYPKGIIKRTFANRYPRTDDITLEEVLQADSVDIAIISSFEWDSEWLWNKLNPLKVKQIWIMNAKDGDTQERFRQDMKDSQVPNLRIHFPPMDGMIHSMHSKFILLFGKNKLRLVVPTANMTPTDWGEVENDWQPGIMENSVFLVDLPRRSDGAVGNKLHLTVFGKEVVNFLEEQQVERQVINGVMKFDFSNTTHLAFVHSIGGAHKGELRHPTGLPGLARAIEDLKLHNVQDIELDYAASSLGAISDTLLRRIYLAARGDTFTIDSDTADIRKHFRIYFPTDDAVQKSIGGPDCGGIITLARQHYNAASFPRECLRNYDSTRRGMLSHNKLLFARGITEDGKPFAWVYVGSANISESAWGGQKVLKSGQMGSLNIRNWECGVVVPVPHEKMAGLELGTEEIPPMNVFEGTIEVPFVFPGSQYGNEQPWFFRRG
ncbi:phospholipase D/nuclease [Ophiobolus disseminans]|uniref:Phospholipase D/nuclease n=1 Tax=Ophiobolus disseminans TaxID=1469910 RepID=A0A6A6ZM29_9PLEO|nr:phospholipase D/nuclease [Ophiobolus disseminans]